MILLTGRNNSRHQRGFSLLELMVVVFIIGLLSTAVVLAIPSRSGEQLLVQERYKLLGALRTARAEAVFSGHSLGLLWQSNQGRFLILSRSGWAPITAGVLAKTIELDASVNSEITLSGQLIETQSSGQNKILTPQLVFLGDGQVSAFEWRLSTAGANSVEFDQRLRLIDDEEAR
ncbi:GspH/FimT family pseudopilin [Spongiibacter sp. KMU-158]|uniref:Type II secretion system protein H n=1 Tax=Spongiibacter pelagi TaxID=2760804 RepID=A0A927C312_9GAMM|nr:GspH/FimT family pseudopilin [Spongiibacter pelagi]MBD2858550.1 GspH/FimT family pseudopilin [Spongiibacter pelagi]